MSIVKPQQRQTRRLRSFAAFAAVCAAAVILASTSAHAAILAKYNLDGTGASSDTDANSIAQPFQVNSAGGGISSSTNTAFLRSNYTGSTEATALSDTDYMTFELDATPGHVLDLTSLVFDFGSSTGTGSMTNAVYVQSSVDGFGPIAATVLAAYQSTHSNTGGQPVVNTISPIVDLTDARFQGLSSITFHLSFADTIDDSGYINRIDNVIINGTAVPTPAALPGGLALLTLAGLRRRRRTQ